MRRLLYSAAAAGALLAAAGVARAQAGDPDAGEDPMVLIAQDVRRAGIEEPLTFDKRLATGRAALRAKRYLDAAREFYEAAQLSPAHPVPQFLFAHAMFGLHSWREAAGVLRKALGMYPRWRRLRVKVANDFADADEWATLLRTLEEARSREPVGSPARREYAFLLGYGYLGGGETSKARLCFVEAADGPAPLAEARAYVEELDRRAGQAAPAPGGAVPPGGSGERPTTGSASPQSEPDPFRRGNALVLDGRYAEAADAFAEAVVSDPGGMNGILAHFELSHACFAAQRFSEACTALRRGLARYPDWPKVTLNRRDWYPPARPGDFEDHFRALEAAVRAAPKNTRLQFLLGYTCYFIGRRVQARQAFDAVCATGPDAMAKAFLAGLDAAEGATPGPPATGPAPAPAAAPASAPGGTTPASDTFAQAEGRFAKREYAAAWPLYEAAVATAPNRSEARFAAGRAAFALGDWTSAVAHLRAGLRLHTPSEWRKLPIRWREGFSAVADFDAQLERLRGAVEGLERFDDLDLRFLLAFSYLYAGKLDQAIAQFRVHHELDKKGTDAEAKGYWERLGGD